MHRRFEEDIDKLRTRLIRMGSLVEEQVEFAFRALNEGNTMLAKIVAERDDKVDKLDIRIDKQCQRIFALQQPVASDLRLILAALKINNELERIGDMAVEIARITSDSKDYVELAERLGMQRITVAAFKMVKASLDAFVNNDPELARHIIPTDNTVDALERELFEKLILIMEEDPSTVRTGARFVSILRLIERMADHAVNIAENVIFVLEAKLVRHSRMDEAEFEPGFDATMDDSDL